MKYQILIVEDETAIVKMIKIGLGDCYGYQEADSLANAKQSLKKSMPHLILLDWMLGDGNGIDLLKIIRSQPDTQQIPVIFLTARASETDIIHGLNHGADDYITKPFSIAQLKARINAVLRRNSDLVTKELTINWQDITIDLEKHNVFYQNQLVSLHRREFQLLNEFIQNAGKVQTRVQLLDRIWGDDIDVNDRAVDVTIRRLRKSFEKHRYEIPIKTIRGIGYRFG